MIGVKLLLYDWHSVCFSKLFCDCSSLVLVASC